MPSSAMAVVLAVFFTTFALFTVGSVLFIYTFLAFSGSAACPWVRAGMVLIGVGIVAGIGTIVHRNIKGNKGWGPLALFARDNGLNFRMRSANPAYPGTLFQIGSSREAYNHMWSPTAVLADVGAYKDTTGSGDNQRTHHWNFVCFRLPRPVPHIVLDSTANGTGNLPLPLAKEQRVQLGEPFDSRYRLYAPAGYAADAFRLFPPI